MLAPPRPSGRLWDCIGPLALASYGGSQLALPPRLNKNLAARLGFLGHRLDCVSCRSAIIALDDPGELALRIMDLGLLLSF